MASRKFVARTSFNAYTLKFIELVVKNFPECVYTKETFLPFVRSSIEKGKDTILLDVFMKSMVPFGERLVKRDETLFAEKECVFLQYLCINTIWAILAKRSNQKEAELVRARIWRQLNGAFLLIKGLVVAPPKALSELEKLLDAAQKRAMNQLEFDEKQFREYGINILSTLGEKEINTLTDFMFEFLSSENTPVFDFLDNQYHPLAKLFLERISQPEGKNYLLNKLAPMVNDVTKRIGETKLTTLTADDEMTGGEENPDFLEKRRIIIHVLDVIVKVLKENQQYFTEIGKSPVETMKRLVMSVAMPAIQTLINATESGLEVAKPIARKSRLAGLSQIKEFQPEQEKHETKSEYKQESKVMNREDSDNDNNDGDDAL